jgi:molybdopterin-guanine dinucleotide biosynthesis protein A
MGAPKATIELGGMTLGERAARALHDAGLKVAWVVKEGDTLPAATDPVWVESRAERHPLAGILEALERAGGAVVVIACDMPFVAPALVADLAARTGTVVPEAGGRLHPLLARYDPGAAEALAAAYDSRAPLHEAVRTAGATVMPESELARFGDPARLFFNVNTPADLTRAEELLREPA